MEALFEQAMEKIFSRWTLLNLAVEQGWGGRESRAKRDQLQAEIVERLQLGSRKKRPPAHTNVDDVSELASFIYGRLDELFNVEADDDSDKEVAAVCLQLFTSCKAGDASFAQQLLHVCSQLAPADLSACKGTEHIEYATDEDLLLDQMQGMEIDADCGDDASGGGLVGDELGSSSMWRPFGQGRRHRGRHRARRRRRARGRRRARERRGRGAAEARAAGRRGRLRGRHQRPAAQMRLLRCLSAGGGVRSGGGCPLCEGWPRAASKTSLLPARRRGGGRPGHSRFFRGSATAPS
ncbi:unnamed protein product [Prorocentrum cordatum]|uniref:Pre-rRNA-processing protein TSR2 n=1 Tax=Prorocentrum cordatum TaxID=2364126 RepID=A0ABN9WPZ0_9DINO|nr:unnamed protein product [Polarella glacialis]